MKVLITGATGLLGGHLLKELQQRGEDIRARSPIIAWSM